MAKDLRGNDIKPGDILLVNGMMVTVKDITEGGLIGATSGLGKSVQGMVIPGSIVCEITFNFECGKPINAYMLKNPPEDKRGQA